MRLWHKIFLIVLVFVTISVEATSIYVAESSFSASISSEEENAAAAQISFSSGLVNRTMYERIRTGAMLLSQEELTDIIRELAADAGSFYGDIVVLGADGSLVYPSSTDYPDEIFELSIENGQCKSLIMDIEDRVCLVTVSMAELEKMEYKLFTIRNLTEAYAEHSSRLTTINYLSMGLALLAAVLISVLISLTLRPLGRVNSGLKKITEGDYSVRLPESGGVEFSRLSKNVNTMTKAIQENVERIEGIAESRKRFVDSFAHEMKTPLTSIIGFADILRIRRTVTDKQRMDYSNIIVEEATRMKSLSGKLLEIATTDSANLDLEDIYVPGLITEVYNSTLPLVGRKNMRLRYAFVKVWIRGDRELFKSLLYNLIDNAVKASDEGGEVRLVVEQEGDRALISVTDDGCGMAREDVLRVTEPFYMVDKSRSRKAGGAGLGLSLCAEICKRHNAVMTIDSILGEGTMITINIKCFTKLRRRGVSDAESEKADTAGADKPDSAAGADSADRFKSADKDSSAAVSAGAHGTDKTEGAAAESDDTSSGGDGEAYELTETEEFEDEEEYPEEDEES